MHIRAVLVDDVLPSLLPCGAAISHLIHYELPKNKTAFTNRLALLYTAIHRYCAMWKVNGGVWNGVLEEWYRDHGMVCGR